MVSKAQSLVATLNSLSQNMQSLRQDTETQIQSSVTVLNQSLQTLAQINKHLADQTGDPASRSALMDQRDRLVSQISEQVDVQASTTAHDGTVALMTRTGVGVLDVKAATFQFEPAGTLTADKQFGMSTAAKSGVGKLTLVDAVGLSLDLVQQNVLQSGIAQGAGEPARQDAGGGAKPARLGRGGPGAVDVDGDDRRAPRPASGAKGGYSADLSSIRDGNDLTLNYSAGGAPKTIRVVRVDDTSKLPLDYTDANGARVIGMSFAGGASGIATALSSGAGQRLHGQRQRQHADGARRCGQHDGRRRSPADATATALQTEDGLRLQPVRRQRQCRLHQQPRRQGPGDGFASRIQVNSAILADNKYAGAVDADRARWATTPAPTTCSTSCRR